MCTCRIITQGQLHCTPLLYQHYKSGRGWTGFVQIACTAKDPREHSCPERKTTTVIVSYAVGDFHCFFCRSGVRLLYEYRTRFSIIQSPTSMCCLLRAVSEKADGAFVVGRGAAPLPPPPPSTNSETTQGERPGGTCNGEICDRATRMDEICGCEYR